MLSKQQEGLKICLRGHCFTLQFSRTADFRGNPWVLCSGGRRAAAPCPSRFQPCSCHLPAVLSTRGQGRSQVLGVCEPAAAQQQSRGSPRAASSFSLLKCVAVGSRQCFFLPRMPRYARTLGSSLSVNSIVITAQLQPAWSVCTGNLSGRERGPLLPGASKSPRTVRP